VRKDRVNMHSVEFGYVAVEPFHQPLRVLERQGAREEDRGDALVRHDPARRNRESAGSVGVRSDDKDPQTTLLTRRCHRYYGLARAAGPRRDRGNYVKDLQCQRSVINLGSQYRGEKALVEVLGGELIFVPLTSAL
jgi:hypothetical protein